jgi:hypothetical protein
MNAKVKKYIAALMALALVSAGAGMVSAAPGSIDGSQTDTTDEVYVSDEKTMDAEFNASGDTTWNMTIQNVPDGDELAMNVTHDDVEYYEFTGDFSSYNDTDPDADSTTNGRYHTFTDDELDRVPMAINENVTLNVTYWNASADLANRTPTTIQVYVENTDERSVQRVTEDAAFADVETVEPPLYRPLTDDYDSVEVDDTVDINGTNTTVIYTLSDSAVQDPFANRTEELDSGGFTLMVASMTGDNDETVPVFMDETPDWYDEDEMGSYAVYDSDNNLVEFHPSEDNFEGETSADVMASSDVYRIGDVYTVWNLAGGYSGAGLDAVLAMAMG